MLGVHWLLIKILDGIHRISKIIFHYLLCLVYCSGSRKVPSVQDPILQMSATELAEQIREGKLTSEIVVQAFIRRILIVDPFINATAERRFNEALEEAREVDALIKSGTVNMSQLAKEKPLLGVPLTVKVMLSVKGMKKTSGSLLYKDEIADEDAPVVALMKEAGAIVIATTSMSEVGCGIETFNHLQGTTCNPYDTNKTCGGSSGGEAALLAAAGSVIGLGNDMGGSIRIPCMFCGVFGHKPSRGLVSNEGGFPPLPEKLRWEMLYTGPMCRYAQDLVTTMKILASPTNMWEQKVNFEELNVYYLRSLGHIEFMDEVEKDMSQCIEKVASYFETKQGFKVKEVSLPLLKMGLSMGLANAISLIPNFGRLLTAGRTDLRAPKELIKFLFRQSQLTLGPIFYLCGYAAADLIFKAESLQYYKKNRKELEKELNHLLDERSVLVMPTLPFAAPYHKETFLNIYSAACYTAMFNFTGHPVTQCPVGFNREGLPLGVQIVGRKGNDHLTIACAAELEKAFGGWKPPN